MSERIVTEEEWEGWVMRQDPKKKINMHQATCYQSSLKRGKEVGCLMVQRMMEEFPDANKYVCSFSAGVTDLDQCMDFEIGNIFVWLGDLKMLNRSFTYGELQEKIREYRENHERAPEFYP